MLNEDRTMNNEMMMMNMTARLRSFLGVGESLNSRHPRDPNIVFGCKGKGEGWGK